ncbi:RnfH family protein [Pseudoxanthomonas putridarboris]|uniref:UPF0125 protein AAD027_09375 n=1 Tax=Pseudoxanthomonas putridarboris TaxID=752605 RepID=A0ABU9J022_9GAMM
MRVEVIRAWPHRYQSVALELPLGACVADALAVCGFDGLEQASAIAVHGVVVAPDAPLNEGDRVEVLRPLQVDPKEARRRRARKPAP